MGMQCEQCLTVFEENGAREKYLKCWNLFLRTSNWEIRDTRESARDIILKSKSDLFLHCWPLLKALESMALTHKYFSGGDVGTDLPTSANLCD